MHACGTGHCRVFCPQEALQRLSSVAADREALRGQVELIAQAFRDERAKRDRWEVGGCVEAEKRGREAEKRGYAYTHEEQARCTIGLVCGAIFILFVGMLNHPVQ